MQYDTPILVDSEKSNEDVLVFRTSADEPFHLHAGMKRVKAFKDSVIYSRPYDKLVMRVEGPVRSGRTQLARYVLPHVFNACEGLFPVRRGRQPDPSSPRSIYIDCRDFINLRTIAERYCALLQRLGSTVTPAESCYDIEGRKALGRVSHDRCIA